MLGLGGSLSPSVSDAGRGAAVPAPDTPRILVTGGAGFIGSALCRHLVGSGAIVLNVDKLTYAANLLSLETISRSANYGLLAADICDADRIASAFADFRPDTVMHLAAESHVDRSISNSSEFIRTNIVGTHTMLQVALTYWRRLPPARATAFRFLHVSTDEVYGSLGPEGAFVEETPYDPSSPYSASKAASDHLVIAWHRTYGMPTLVSNCSNNYGPHQFPEKLIPLAITNAIQGLPIPVYGDGLNVRDWIFVDDHVRALVATARLGVPGNRYNIGGRSESSNIDLVRALCTILDEALPGGAPHNRLITFVADRPGHDLRYAIDATKVESRTGWLPRETIGSGLRKTVDWYLEHRRWWQPLRAAYAGERLGLLETAVAAN